MIKKLLGIFLLFFSMSYANAQARLVINGTVFLVLSGGTNTAPVYLVIDNKLTEAITRIGTTGGIQTFGEYDRIKWYVKDAIAHADTTFEFPFFDTLETTYTPFRFNIASAGSADAYVSVSTWYAAGNAEIPAGYTVGPDENNAIDRFWSIDVGGTTKPTANVRFYINSIDLDGLTPSSDLGAQRGNTSLTGSYKWETPAVGTWVDAAVDYIEVLNVANFSPWTIAKKSSSLPIELLSFSGQCENGTPVISWETASETNNSYFTLERSSDGIEFETVGTKEGAGNSGMVLYYDLSDKSPIYGTAYYRLKQNDFDGKYSYSDIIAVQSCRSREGEEDHVAIFIGGNDQIIVNASFSYNKKYNLYFYDYLGRVVHSQLLNVPPGRTSTELNHLKLAAGTYLISLQNEEEILTKKLFVR